MPRSALHGRVSRRLDSKAQFARSHHRGLVYRLRPLRAELSLRQYQFAPVRSDGRRSGASWPQKSRHQAKSDFMRSLHALERTQLRLRLSPRRRASRRPAHVFRRDTRPGPWQMRMDKTQRGWALASLAILALSAFVYVLYAFEAPQGPRGGSAIGLAFGIIGFAFMIFAALLGARKRVPTWRIGRTQAWMRGHLWLGFLALPMILFHGGFHLGGTLTRVLVWLLIITVLSGVFGAALQHYIPRVMTTDAPLRRLYLNEMRPFLERPKQRGQRLTDAGKASSAFAGLRTLLPAAAHVTLADLEDICDEARQLTRQERLHHWLHGWLLLHIPLSLALILLGAVHAVMALRY